GRGHILGHAARRRHRGGDGADARAGRRVRPRRGDGAREHPRGRPRLRRVPGQLDEAASAARPGLRDPGAARLTSYDPFVERLSREELEVYQLAKLRSQLRYVLAASPFYRRKLELREEDVDRLTLADLPAAVPVTRKAELVADQAEEPPFGTGLAADRSQVAQVT